MILVDSNVIIYHLNGVAQATRFLQEHRGHMCICMITVAEVLSFAPNAQALAMTEKMLQEQFT